MAIFLNENSKVIVQGMTGSEGRKHTQRMLASGTAIVGGVNPKKAGQSVDFDGASVPVFGNVAEAMKETGADVSVIFVPPAGARNAAVLRVEPTRMSVTSTGDPPKSQVSAVPRASEVAVTVLLSRRLDSAPLTGATLLVRVAGVSTRVSPLSSQNSLSSTVGPP